MTEKLNLICTPIGNLSDISERAITTLEESDIILVENASRSRKLFTFKEISLSKIRLIEYFKEKEEGIIEQIKIALIQNKKVSLISDAGTPGINDPGCRIVREIRKSGFNISVVPGPSALTAAIMGSGMTSNRFAFLGFLPKTKSRRVKIIKSVLSIGLSMVIFESPLRAKSLLKELHLLCGSREVVVAREMTKKFETFHYGFLGKNLTPDLVEQGEIVILIDMQNLEQ